MSNDLAVQQLEVNSLDAHHLANCLNQLSDKIRDLLPAYESLHEGKLKFGSFQNLGITPEENYSARTDVPVLMRGKEEGSLKVILFLEEDGTGDERDFKLGSFKGLGPGGFIPKRKPAAVVPVYRKEVYAEGFFPIFIGRTIDLSWGSGSDLGEYAAHLSGITMRDNSLVSSFSLGQSKYALSKSFYGIKLVPEVQYSLVRDAQGKSLLGDPSSIFCHRDNPFGHIKQLQVGGFLTIESKDSPLVELTQYWNLPSVHHTINRDF